MEVYCKLVDADLRVMQDVEARIIDEKSFSDFLVSQKIVFFGDGALKCRELIRHANASFLENVYPSAAQLGLMANTKLSAGLTEDVMHFEPFYLKDFLVKKPA
jgi:tRNA threonylcarbamoyladenosine biosynthesis protein TsaB